MVNKKCSSWGKSLKKMIDIPVSNIGNRGGQKLEA
jgi:hypothetical protein